MKIQVDIESHSHSGEEELANTLKANKVGDKYQTPDGQKHTLGGVVSRAMKAGQNLIIDSTHEYTPVKRKRIGK